MQLWVTWHGCTFGVVRYTDIYDLSFTADVNPHIAVPSTLPLAVGVPWSAKAAANRHVETLVLLHSVSQTTTQSSVQVRHRFSIRADSRLAASQWEMSLQSNAVSHWLGANLESAPSMEIIDWRCTFIDWAVVMHLFCFHWLPSNLLKSSQGTCRDHSGYNCLGMGSANERWPYYVIVLPIACNVTPSPIGWAHTQNNP